MLNSLIQQPQSSAPPEQQGSSGTADASPLQALLQKGGASGQPSVPSVGGALPPSDYKTTVAAVQHIHAFDQHWKQMLAEPDIGTKNVRQEIYDVMADLMGDGYCSLPQVMSLLKTFPTDPLEQKQWLEKHVQQDEQAVSTLLSRHAQSNPGVADWPTEQANMQQAIPPGNGGLADNHLQMMGQLADRYKAHPKKKPIGGMPKAPGGIPMRMQ